MSARIVMLNLPVDVYRRLLRSAERNGRTPAKEIEHLILSQFDRDYSLAEFDKLAQKIRQGRRKD